VAQPGDEGRVPAGPRRELDGPRDGLVEAGVEHPELGTGARDHRVHAGHGVALGPERAGDRVVHVVAAARDLVRAGRALVCRGDAERGQPAVEVGDVDLASRRDQAIPALRDLPGLADGRVDAVRDLAQAVVQRPLRRAVDGGVEPAPRLERLLHEASPRLVDRERIDPLAPRPPAEQPGESRAERGRGHRCRSRYAWMAAGRRIARRTRRDLHASLVLTW
jgi:hypothetical protein